MIEAALSAAAHAMQGSLHGAERDFRGVSTDTRTLRADELYFALQGPNFDGHSFVPDAADKGAAGVVVSRAVDCTIPQIQVDDTLLALGDLAADWRGQMPARVVGLTGSNGKTTLKEMISSCLSQRAATIATEGNLNNEIGVPLMLLRLAPEHQFAVIEMGANHIGEIAYLTDRVAPHVVVITNAGPAHLEGFGSLDGVAQGKGEILQGEPRPRFAVLNADDHYFDYWREFVADIPMLSFGTGELADFRASDIRPQADGIEFELSFESSRIPIRLGMPGRHNAVNASAAAAVARGLDLTPEEIQRGLNSVSPVAGRLNATIGAHGVRLIDDSYNANPTSVLAAAEYLGAQDAEGWLVVGDMAELGNDADELHRSTGESIRESGVRRVFAVGPHSRFIVEGFGSGARWFEGVEELITELRGEIEAAAPGNLLVKGSRSMRMERVLDALRADAGEVH
ncbi:MAG: UDP-N-acetylmuramoyl-tripeptide--D-alanyl-D-alanine ligase [Gammaproteobacteria bacterium]|nr:UDP-N-acetylmuramoyl-tripeptide--D-alanyl-D-alanine ligase [Gammaproteobacteria bacterium]